MNPLTANQLSQGANQRLGNNVHKRGVRSRHYLQLSNSYEFECEIRSIVNNGHAVPRWYVVAAREDVATAKIFNNETDFIAQTTVNVAEGT